MCVMKGLFLCSPVITTRAPIETGVQKCERSMETGGNRGEQGNKRRNVGGIIGLWAD